MKKLFAILFIFVFLTQPVLAATDVKNDANLSTNLVSYWELEESSGTRVDSHGSNDLTDNNTVTSATGIQGNGADFESTNSEYLSITDGSQTGLDFSTAFSTSFWVKTESDTDALVVSKYSAASPSYYVQINVSSPNDYIRFSDGTSIVDSNATTWIDGTWYHIAVTYNAGTVNFYLDGSAHGSGSVGTSLPNSTANFQLSSYDSGGNLLDGVLDEVGVWNKVLTSTEVSDLYNSGSGIPYDAGAPTVTPQPIIWFD